MSIRQSHARARLDSTSNGIVMTPAEFDAVSAYDDEYCYELVNGVVIVNPIPVEAESDPNGELEFLLRDYKHNHPHGSALDKPDPNVDPPTIVVEFVSAAKRDRQRDYEEKRLEYREAGVKEYWVIDRFQRIMTIYYLDETEQRIRETDLYRTDLLPGFELPLARLLAIADDWQAGTE